MRRALAAWAGLACFALAAESQAQQVKIAADADVLLGIEGGGSGYAKGVRRARTTLRLGAQGFMDEFPKHGLSAAMLVEVEPHAAVGFDVRYQYHLDDFVFHVGPAVMLAPGTLLGATAGATYELPVADFFAFDFGAAMQVYFLGSDLPERTVLWQALGQTGVRVRF